MTEAAYFGSVAQKDCFNELDVEKFEVVATLDNRTSDVCQEMDGKVFDMADFQAGVTAPPFHVWCRSCTAPWFPDDDDSMRAARNADGQTYYVPSNMKYPDWKQTFVNGGSKAGLKPVVDVDALRNQLLEKQKEFNQVAAEANVRVQEQTEFLAGWNDPDFKKLHDMSDREFQMWQKVLKDQEDALTAQMDQVYEDYQKFLDRPDRKSPERAAWDQWHDEIVEKYGVRNGVELYNKYDYLQNDRRVVRNEINATHRFSKWKTKFNGKTKEFYEEEIFRLTKEYNSLQTEINDLRKQIEEAVKAQTEAAYSAKTLREIQDEIIKKHDSILKTDVHKKEFSDIIDSMDKERANLYNKMSENFSPHEYYQEKTGWYLPSQKRIQMDLNSYPWDDRLERNLQGAWKTKFHEEMHQLDHILGERKSPFAKLYDEVNGYANKMTAPTTVTGKKMIEAIDEDVLNFINEAVDWDVVVNGASAKHIKSLGRISSDAKDATIRYLQMRYPTKRDKASIDTLTDVIGLTTKGNLHPWSHGFWGHDKTYSKDRGKVGATSEAWANLGCFFLRNDTEILDILTDVMPKTVSTFRSVFDEVLEYAKTNPLSYKP